MAGIIRSIEPFSVAAAADLRPGDALLAINDHRLRDVIDAQFYAAEDQLDLTFERAGVEHGIHVRREFGQALGITSHLRYRHPPLQQPVPLLLCAAERAAYAPHAVHQG
jgi:membrane-associated protease RseP (regulator of RpoE activity)